MTKIGEISNDVVRERLQTDGYVYIDEVNHKITSEMPDRGWYLYTDGEEAMRLRLDTKPYDGDHLRTDVGAMEAVKDEYRPTD